MRFLFLAVTCAVARPSLMEVDRWLKNDPNSPEMMAARKEEISFIEQTLHAMEFNKQEVINSNRELDKQVRESERRLRKITDEVTHMTQKTKERMETVFPFSLFESSNDGDDDDGSDEPIPPMGNKPASFLQTRDEKEKIKIETAKSATLLQKNDDDDDDDGFHFDERKSGSLKQKKNTLSNDDDDDDGFDYDGMKSGSLIQNKNKLSYDDDDDEDDGFHYSHQKPASFVQTKHKSDGETHEDNGEFAMRKSSSALEMANARAAASEQRFRDAMKKLEADRQALLQDERMRRARAQQERRHIHV